MNRSHSRLVFIYKFIRLVITDVRVDISHYGCGFNNNTDLFYDAPCYVPRPVPARYFTEIGVAFFDTFTKPSL